MEKYTINDLLRYILIGSFFITLLYVISDKTVLQENIKILGQSALTASGLVLCLMSGAIIYLLYRSFIYSMILNPIVTMLVKPFRVIKLGDAFKSCGISETIRMIDKKRWAHSNDAEKKNLSEWASQVHFLYNMSFCGLYAYLLICLFPTIFIGADKYLISLAVIVFILSLIHHIRYKRMEIEILKTTPA